MLLLHLARLRLAVLVAVLVLAPALAAAAGLGRMTVLSSLGQPLNAEIELTATKEELATMQVRVAAPEAFRKANIEFTPLVASIRLGVEQRRDGRMVIRVTSARPVNDPFLQVLIELSWASGRLVREYTSLIDPPLAVAEAVPPALPPVAQPQPLPAPAEVLPAPVPAAPEPARPIARAAAEPRPVPEPAKRAARVREAVDPQPAPAAPAADSYGPVRSGETLAGIAGKVRPQGISLDQMLVAMFRHNPEAFAGGNMNRLRAGVILRVPDPQTAAATPENEATREVRAQAADWNRYRQRLAAAVQEAPPGAAQPGQAAAGKIAPRVEDKAVPAQPPREVVKLSKGDVPVGAAPKDAKAAAAAREEDATAREKALREANDRIAQLEKMIKDAQSLLAVQSKQLAELQKQVQAAAKPAPAVPAVPAQPEPAPAAKAPEPPKPAPPVEPAKVVPAAPVEPPKPAEPPRAEEPAKPVEPPKPAAEAPKPKPAPPPPPAPAPSFVESLLQTVQEFALLLGAGLVLVLGLAWYAVRRRHAATDRQAAAESPVAPAEAGPSPALADAGAPLVEAVPAAPLRRREEEELDPLQEAETYITYGRDAQAEAVLKEAIAKWPRRHELQVKLLELYAKRSDLSAFEGAATELFAQTGGQGLHWQRAAEMGYALDPENPLYESGKSLEPEELRTTTMTAAPATVAGAAVAAGVAGGLAALAARGALPDADATVALGARTSAASPPPDMTSTQVLAVGETVTPSLAVLDLDMTSPQTLPPVSSEGTVTAELPDLVFDQPLAGGATSNLDMDFTLEAGPGQAAAESAAPDISLDAGAGGPTASTLTPDLVLDIPDRAAGSTAAPDLTLDLEAPPAAATAFTPDFTLDIAAPPADPDATVLAPSSAAVTDVRAQAPATDRNVIDFDLDTSPAGLLSESSAPSTTTDFQDTFVLGTMKETGPGPGSLEDTLVLGTVKEPKTGDFEDTFVLASAKELAPFDPGASGGMPMESSQITLPRIDLDMGGIVAETATGVEVRDERWNDVATKLDLAKAYEEMGDNEGAREILQEVLQEGDDKQRAEAQTMLVKLG
jgi:pilus assembly protein FimV